MQAAEAYLKQRVSFPALIKKPPQPRLNNVIVIPCHDEERVMDTISSLTSCALPRYPVEVIIVINSSEKDPRHVVQRNRDTFRKIKKWAVQQSQDRIAFFPLLFTNLPAGKAGVGLARKIGMDEAVRRFLRARQEEGIITSLDADTLTDPDYLTAIEEFFTENPGISGAAVYFEHPLEGTSFPGEVYEAITRYELHLRYFVNALRLIGYPFAYHTVGSAFAVRADAYVSQGGMNTRQGGEDFYFLQKIIKLGHFADLTTTRVLPSPRPGTKVPFGTGPEIKKFLTGEKKEFMTYAPEAFRELARFFSLITPVYTEKIPPGEVFERFPPALRQFLGKEPFVSKIEEILANVSTEKTFLKRFYHWFDTFRVIKFLNYSHHGSFFSKKPVTVAARDMLEGAGIAIHSENARELLEWFRKTDRSPGKIRDYFTP